jgi:hypothetical protein
MVMLQVSRSDFTFSSFLITSPDSALLKFADSLLASVDAARGRWQHVYKMAFNSKVRCLSFRLRTVPERH